MTFVFDRNFDEELLREAIVIGDGVAGAEERDALLRDAEDRARQEGFEAGRQVGHAEGRAELEAQHFASRDAALRAIVKGCEALCKEAENHRRTLESDMIDFALTTCEKVLPELIRSQSSDRVVAEIRRYLSLAMGSPKLTISMSEAAFEEHGATLEQALVEQAATTAIKIAVDDELAVGDARMEWQNGTMQYSFERICGAVLNALRSVRHDHSEITENGRIANV